MFMGTFYSDEQIQEAIAAPEGHTPGIWENLKETASLDGPLSEAQEKTLTACTRVFNIVFPKLSFIARAQDKREAIHNLNLDLGAAVRAAIAADSA